MFNKINNKSLQKIKNSIIESIQEFVFDIKTRFADTRNLREIKEECQILYDKIWYGFHLSAISNGGYDDNKSQEILQRIFSQADRLVDKYGEENLIINDYYDAGEVWGKYAALSWVLGADWDDI